MLSATSCSYENAAGFTWAACCSKLSCISFLFCTLPCCCTPPCCVVPACWASLHASCLDFLCAARRCFELAVGQASEVRERACRLWLRCRRIRRARARVRGRCGTNTVAFGSRLEQFDCDVGGGCDGGEGAITCDTLGSVEACLQPGFGKRAVVRLPQCDPPCIARFCRQDIDWVGGSGQTAATAVLKLSIAAAFASLVSSISTHAAHFCARADCSS
mmetsp:Transcript_48673/g.80864  ORF Transcript_48673/g.80864 Transcript_48673/m.80864 type:complete len:217 (-) Transcript_48673:368-1018(-)